MSFKMSIWFEPTTIEIISERSKNSMADFLGIKFTEITANSITAIMPVSDKIKQPIGIVHGGANVVLAETIASTAANYVIDLKKYFAVGLEINANHLRQVREGVITAITMPIHLGGKTQVWSVDIFDDKGNKTCISRMTACIVERK
ncbi:MAG: hypothetical protein A3E88_00590 [Legionellales bacterium RIFCSPHIGHO2_12_FULL_35_11]|nr:MAG: hypothetical protein A3E88_00590 [Legionellales bacterium RIFCSPHIGHO2_12_FULL_35_11]